MPIIARTKCFVGTSVEASEKEKEQALALATMLFKRNFLPVVPFFYELFGATGEDYQHIRLDMLSQCKAVVWIGKPTEHEAKLCVELGIATRSIE